MTAKTTRARVGLAAFALLGLIVPTIPAASDDDRGGSRAVYAMTNHPTGNTIAVFARFSDGSLRAAGEFATGGLGTGGGPDPLASQGSLILDRELLFAVNAGSDEVSVLAARDEGLVLVDKVPSGGIRPTSLALHGRLLYVLNAGSGTITGFVVSRRGTLAPLPDSTRPLTGGATADPAQVAFTPDGRLLVVTEKRTNLIDTYVVGRDGRPSGPRAHPSHGSTPFGFGFDRQDTLVVSEAFGGAPGQGAVSSYDVSRGGNLAVISGSVPDFQTAACWIVITRDGRYVYTTNTGSSTVSSYRLRRDGTLRLLEAVAASTDPGSSPIDMALTHRFLYVLNGAVGTINGFRVDADGSLSPVGGAGGLPPYTQGIAAR